MLLIIHKIELLCEHWFFHEPFLYLLDDSKDTLVSVVSCVIVKISDQQCDEHFLRFYTALGLPCFHSDDHIRNRVRCIFVLSDGEVLLIDIHLDVLPCGILEEVIPKNNPYFLYKFFL